MMVSLTSCETSKGIAEVVDFLQNHGFLFANTRLFSLQDELCRTLCALFRSANRFEVVSGHSDRNLTITGRNIFACVSFLTLHFQENCYAEKSNEESRQEGR